MEDSFIILQSERSQFRARGPEIRVKNALDPQTYRDLDKHRGVFDIDYLNGWNLRDIERNTKDVCVRLSQVDEAGGNEKIHEPVYLELSDSVRIQFPCFVADRNNLQSIPFLKLADQLYHLGMRLGLREHKFPKLSASKRSLLVEYHPTQIFFQRELSLLVSVEGQVMSMLHLGQLQFEVRRRPSAGMMIPPVGEQDPPDIQKQAGDCSRFLHRLSFRRSDHCCQRIRASSSGIATPSQYGIIRAV
jgi:hypothetical protein